MINLCCPSRLPSSCRPRLATLALILSLLCSGGALSAEPIRIITNNWSSQIVLAHVTAEIFRRQGYEVRLMPMSIDQQWGALAYGHAHVQVEVWEGTMADMFSRMLNEGAIIDAGQHAALTREDWWYPAYVEEVCPGLPDWRALRECAALFALPDSDGEGVYFAGPWEKPDAARIRALDMGFRIRQLASGDELWVELERAMQRQRPVVLFNWSPNWVESRHPGSFVDFPAYEPACEKDPGWGVNPTFTYDCGNPKDGWLKKAVWAGMPARWPCAYFIVETMSLSNAQLAVAAAFVDVDGLNFVRAAERWMQDYQALWESWVPKECKRG